MAPLSVAFSKDGAPTEPIIQHARCFVELSAVVGKEEFNINTGITPNRCSITHGDHTQATEATVEVFGSVFPFPIREFGSGFVRIFMGATEDPSGTVNDEKYLQFIGYWQELEMDSDGKTVKIKAIDLSQPARDHKSVLPIEINNKKIDPTPFYSDTLKIAIEKILSVVPGFTGSDPILTVRDNAVSRTRLGSVVEGRHGKGAVRLKPEWSAWQCIEHLCGLAALHVGVELREVVVRTSDEVFNNNEPVATFLFGTDRSNAFGPTFHKKFTTNVKGIRVVARNPQTMKRVEAVYPPDNALPPRKRPPPPGPKPGSKRKTGAKKPLEPPEREIYELIEGAYSASFMLEKAKAIYSERSNFECEGTVSTPLWTNEVLSLRNAHRIRIRVHPDIAFEVERLGNTSGSVEFLKQRLGIAEDVARSLVSIVLRTSLDIWYVKTVTKDWPSERLVTVNFLSLV